MRVGGQVRFTRAQPPWSLRRISHAIFVDIDSGYADDLGMRIGPTNGLGRSELAPAVGAIPSAIACSKENVRPGALKAGDNHVEGMRGVVAVITRAANGKVPGGGEHAPTVADDEGLGSGRHAID